MSGGENAANQGTIRPIQAGNPQSEGKYRSCRTIPIMLYGVGGSGGRLDPVCLVFALHASVLQDASLDLVNCQKAEGARARATRAGATRFIIAVARHRPKQQSSQPLAPATAFASSLRVLCARGGRGGAAQTGPDDSSRRSDFCKLSAQRAQANASLRNK